MVATSPHPLVDIGFRHTRQAQRKRHVLGDVHMRVERIILEHHRQVTVLRFQMADRLFVDIDFALGDGLQTGDHPQDRRLAAAG